MHKMLMLATQQCTLTLFTCKRSVSNLCMSQWLHFNYIFSQNIIILKFWLSTITPCWCLRLKLCTTSEKSCPARFNWRDGKGGRRIVTGGNHGYHKQFKIWTVILMVVIVVVGVVNRWRHRAFKHNSGHILVLYSPAQWFQSFLTHEPLWCLKNFCNPPKKKNNNNP